MWLKNTVAITLVIFTLAVVGFLIFALVGK